MTLRIFSFLLGVGLCSEALLARTWTLADGSRSWEGEFRYYNATTGEVMLEVAGKRKAFGWERLSSEDQGFVRELGERARHVDVAGLLAKTKLTQLREGQFRAAKCEGEPDYYLVYFGLPEKIQVRKEPRFRRIKD